MDELNCPACGEGNSVEAEYCKFCLEPLHPLKSEPTTKSGSKDDSKINPLPEWLSALQSDQFEPLKNESSNSSIPDWLQNLGQDDNLRAEEHSDAEMNEPKIGQADILEPEAEEEISLASTLSDDALIFENADHVESKSEELIQGEAGLFEDDLSWLDKLYPSEADGRLLNDPKEELSEKVDSDQSEEGRQKKDWLTDENIISEDLFDSPEQEGITGNTVDEMSDWLRRMGIVNIADAQNSQANYEELKAENAGPLAGLLGALPAEPDVAQSSKPPAYSSRLRVSDSQQSNAQLIAEIIQAEGSEKQHQPQKIVQSSVLLRILVASIIFSVVTISIITGFPLLEQPAISAEVFTASQVVSDLSEEKAVLIIVDYSPGFSYEIESNLVVIAEHLLSKRMLLTFASSLPAGSIQAEILASKLAARKGMPDIFKYSNLGFIPGGAAGIQAFAQSPKDMLPFDLSGQSVWNDSKLKDIDQIGDFGLLVVATENPDKAQTWIEQIRSVWREMPIMMVVSSQAEPIIRPYYDASPRQIAGLIAGLSAACEYETLISRPSDIQLQWSPFISVLSFSAILILVSLLISVVAGALRRLKTSKNGKGES